MHKPQLDFTRKSFKKRLHNQGKEIKTFISAHEIKTSRRENTCINNSKAPQDQNLQKREYINSSSRTPQDQNNMEPHMHQKRACIRSANFNCVCTYISFSVLIPQQSMKHIYCAEHTQITYTSGTNRQDIDS